MRSAAASPRSRHASAPMPAETVAGPTRNRVYGTDQSPEAIFPGFLPAPTTSPRTPRGDGPPPFILPPSFTLIVEKTEGALRARGGFY